PRIPSMRLVDIVETIAPAAKLKIIGIRPGEKLHEELITQEEAPRALELETYYVIEPEHPFWNSRTPAQGIRVPEGFQYRSDTNQDWLSPLELNECLVDLGIETFEKRD